MKIKFNKGMAVRIENKVTAVPYIQSPGSNICHSNPVILVVEDDPIQFVLWKAILSQLKRNPTIIWAITEELAVVEFKKRLELNDFFDLVVADIMLPGLTTGMDLWNKYGEQTETPFLFATAMAEAKFQNLNKNIHSMPFLLKKPFEPLVALRVVESLLAFPRAEVTLRRTDS